MHYEIMNFGNLVEILYINERIADVWACEVLNENIFSKSFLHEEGK